MYMRKKILVLVMRMNMITRRGINVNSECILLEYAFLLL
jgi:hypothetical protein